MSSTYQLPPGYTLRVVSSSGDVTVIAEERPDIETPDSAQVRAADEETRKEPRERKGGRRRRHHRKALHFLRKLAGVAARHERAPGPVLEVKAARGGSGDLVVRCPTGTPLSVGTVSGDVELQGGFGDVSVATASGDISIKQAAALDARSVSGNLEVELCAGMCRLNTKSGDIQAGSTGPVEAMTVSGTVELGKTAGRAKVHTVSGDVELGTDGTDSVTVRTVSGGVTVSVAAGRLPDARLTSFSGDVECDCPNGSDFTLVLQSVSGDIEVGPA